MKFKVKYFSMEVKDSIQDPITNPRTVADLIKDDFEYNESMIVVGMDVKNRVIIKKEISRGTYNSLACDPADIFIPLLKTNARHFIIAHNHPSGNVEPSPEDVKFTIKLQTAAKFVGLEFLDHLIIAGDNFYSFKQEDNTL